MSSLEASVTLDDVFTVVAAKRVPLAPELAGYLTLEIADQADAGGGNVEPRTVFISEEGTVALVRPKKGNPTGDAEASVRGFLVKLLDASGSSTPALTAAAKRKPVAGMPALVEELEAALIPVNRAAGRRALARLARETKRVMMGVGRNASVPPPREPEIRARSAFDGEAVTNKRQDQLADEPDKPAALPVMRPPSVPPPRGGAALPPPPVPGSSPPGVAPPPRRGEDPPKLLSGDEVDSLLGAFAVSEGGGEKEMSRELKAIAGLDPTPPPPNAKTLDDLTRDVGRELHKPPHHDSVEALLALAEASGPLAPPLPPPGFGAKSDRPPPPPQPPPVIAPRSPPTPPPMPSEPPPARAPTRRRPIPSHSSGSFAEKRAPKTGLAMLVLALLVLFAGGAAIWKMKPSFFTGKKKPPPIASVSAVPTAPLAPRCMVVLVVSNVPADAEILLRVGQSPVDAERMPVGTRLEFVATAEGYAPRRAVIKAESPWDIGPAGKPRLELPIQLDPSKAKPNQIDPWPPAEPGSEVRGSNSPGIVHVVSSVRGSEIWLLAGLGPEAKIEQLRCDQDIEVLLAGPPTLRQRLRVTEKEIAAAKADPQGNKTVSVSAK